MRSATERFISPLTILKYATDTGRLYEIEKAISDQVLLECGLEVTITERFRLSGQ